jgi:site-specific recombinase XerD
MLDHSLLGPWIRRFLLEYLVAERNLSRNTQYSYRDTLTLLLPFVSAQAAAPIERLAVDDVSADRVRAFLNHVEQERGCGVVTRNQRLGAIHSLARFVGMRSPEHLDWCSQIRSIPFKKAAKTVIGYLDKPEMEALLPCPGPPNELGRARSRPAAISLQQRCARCRGSIAAGGQSTTGHVTISTHSWQGQQMACVSPVANYGDGIATARHRATPR